MGKQIISNSFQNATNMYIRTRIMSISAAILLRDPGRL